jgi:hypothetical protein
MIDSVIDTGDYFIAPWEKKRFEEKKGGKGPGIAEGEGFVILSCAIARVAAVNMLIR